MKTCLNIKVRTKSTGAKPNETLRLCEFRWGIIVFGMNCHWYEFVCAVLWLMRPVFPLAFSGRRPKGDCRYLRLSVCPSVCLSVSTSVCKLYLIRVVTRNRFELESPNLHQLCILGLFRSVLKLGEGGHWPWPSRSFGYCDSISAFNGAFVCWFRPAKGCVARPNVLLYISAFHMFWKFLQVDICILLCVGVIYAPIISQALGLVYIVERGIWRHASPDQLLSHTVADQDIDVKFHKDHCEFK